jgi:hypothetical protein
MKSRRPPKAVEVRDSLLFGVNVIASAFDFFSEMERGAAPLEAAKRGWKRGRKRAKAIAAVDEALPGEDKARGASEPEVIDAEWVEEPGGASRKRSGQR